MDTKVIATLTVGSTDLCGRCEFRPEMDSTLCRLFRCSLLDPHGTPVRCKSCRRAEAFAEALPKWTPVITGEFPPCGKVNGYWDVVPVLVARQWQDGGPLKVMGAFFTYEGGDEHMPFSDPRAIFRTDEGLCYHDVEYWMPMPQPPQQ